MKAVVAAFNQEKALAGAFSVITNLRMDLFEAVVVTAVPRVVIIPSYVSGRRGGEVWLSVLWSRADGATQPRCKVRTLTLLLLRIIRI